MHSGVRSIPQLHTLCTGSALLFWSVAVGLFIYGRRYYRRLSEIVLSPDAMAALPRLSILVPACNEGDTVERAMRRKRVTARTRGPPSSLGIA